MRAPWPVHLVPLQPLACGSVLWRLGAQSRLTFVVKATFTIHHGALAELIAPVGLATLAPVSDDLPDLAPFLPSAGILLTGHACAPQGRPTAASQFDSVSTVSNRCSTKFSTSTAIARDRTRPHNRSSGSPRLGARVPGAPATTTTPSGLGLYAELVRFQISWIPQDPRIPAGYGPLPSAWPARRKLRAHPFALAGSVDRPIVEFPEGFDFRYFHTAPLDQQIDYLHGDECIVLDNMHPTMPRIQTRLPFVRAQARYHVVTAGGASTPCDVNLVADTLALDVEREEHHHAVARGSADRVPRGAPAARCLRRR